MAEQENIKQEYNNATTGLNLDQTLNQVPKGKLTYALNAAVENFDSNSVNYQNEQGNEFCLTFPNEFVLIAKHFIQEQDKHIFFITNPSTGDNEIGYMDNNDCTYHTLVSGKCLGFDPNKPIHKIVHKITNCSVEIYWADNVARRYLDLGDIPYVLEPGSSLCEPRYTTELDCNQLKVQPNFSIPIVKVIDEITGGTNTAGTVQFAVQYADVSSNPYTSYYSVTNPTPIADTRITTPNFNYEVGKSIVVNIDNLDGTGQFQYFNLAVIKTINGISTPELVGTYFIDNTTKTIVYTGQNVTQVKLTINDIFEKHPYYDIAGDITTVQDILVWDNLTSIDRINYQSIFSQLELNWISYKLPANENYADALNATNLRSYLRDEVYALEGVFLLRNGKQTDSFHIPGRVISSYDNSFPDVPNTNPDFIGEPDYYDSNGIGYSPYWKIYNTANVTGPATGNNIGNATPYERGNFAYWESDDVYDCNDSIWGDLVGQKIRHHKFPDVLVSPIFESATFLGADQLAMQNDSVFPLGIEINLQQLEGLISTSNLTSQQKSDIIGIKIIRGDRSTNKSIIGKGILRNVNSYQREEQTYYFPNYPYNDLNEDVFINENNNAYLDITTPWLLTVLETAEDGSPGEYEYTDPNNSRRTTKVMPAVGETIEFCSITRPISLSGKALIGPGNYDVWYGDSCPGTKGGRVTWVDPFTDDNSASVSNSPWLDNYSCFPGGTCDSVYGRVEVDGVMGSTCENHWYDICKCNIDTFLIDSIEQEVGVILPIAQGGRRSKLNCNIEIPLESTESNTSLGYRQIFNSPETSFGQPFLGNVLKLENVMFGAGKGHFVEVKDNAKYKLLSKEAQEDALQSADDIGRITNPFNATAMFTAYQAYLTIYINGITRKNYAYSYNSIASYDYSAPIENNLGIKQRELDLKQYLIPGVQSVGDDHNINNYQRESSVFLRTDLDKTVLPFPENTPSLVGTGVTDKSRLTISGVNACNAPGKEQDISVVSYYASLKNIFNNQWGQIYSYETVDTGFQSELNTDDTPITGVVFGGDTFISRFAFKTKLPFFIDNRVGAPDDSDIFYDEIGNIAYPKYWHSARSILENYTLSTGEVLTNFISYKAHHFDCPNDPASIPSANGAGAYGSYRTYYDGYFYLFAYGVPNFYCESSYNTDLRQAFNNKEGDFWPHVSTGIPDDWVQESFVSIANDNTYYYNITYSKQNRENTFTHLPPDWEEQMCFTNYPFRAIYSDPQATNADVRVNNWLVYKPLSQFDFPQNYGRLISLDGIQNKAVLARFDNKSLLYNNLLTLDTSNPQAAYLGNPKLFEGAPPIDFAETDLGYVGSQNKFLLKIPEGQITIDAKRGQIFLISGTQAIDLSAFGSGMNRWFTDHLSFEILKYFKNINTDNNYTGIGIHGVYDSKFNRIIITKLDYIPIDDDVKYDSETEEFYIETIINDLPVRTQIYLTDTDYFCNKSWTVSFNLNTKSWISFHSYIPNWYIGENNFFYSGLNGCCSDLDADFGALIGEMRLVPMTTTTSTTIFGTSTTTTTLKISECSLEGIILQTDCTLLGEAVVTVPASTTTTICQRPFGLNSYLFYYAYQIDVEPIVNFSSSLDETCEAIKITVPLIPDVTMFEYTFNAASLDIVEYVYLDTLNTDCVLVPDGYYFTQEGQYNGFIYKITDGKITDILPCNCETTDTTTTMAPIISECCGILLNTTDSIYYLDSVGNTTVLDVPGYTNALSLAMTSNYLWTIDATEFRQWDIYLSPFSATFNYDIAFPIGYTNSAGMVALNDNTLIVVDSSTTPEDVIEMDITDGTATPTIQFSLQADRTAHGNMLYTSTGMLLVINEDTITNDYYITQYIYATGAIDLDILAGDIELTAIFECNCNIYVVDADGNMYVVDKTTPYALIQITDFVLPPNSTTQLGSCVIRGIGEEPITTTTTTTL